MNRPEDNAKTTGHVAQSRSPRRRELCPGWTDKTNETIEEAKQEANHSQLLWRGMIMVTFALVDFSVSP